MGGVAILPRPTHTMLVRITVGSRAGEIVEMPGPVAARAIDNGTAELVEDEPIQPVMPPPEERETAEIVAPEAAAFDTGKKRLHLRKRH